MPIRPFRFCLYLSLLVSLWTSAATASEGPPKEVALGVLPESAPTVLINSEQMVQALCTVADPDREPILGKCKATTWNAPKGIQEYETPCGRWEASSATLDRPIVRPGSELALRQADDDPGHGVFAGEFDLIARVRFTHIETGRSVDVKLRFGFNLEGTWVLAFPNEPITMENLILLADRDEEGQIVTYKQWVDLEDEDPHEECVICLLPNLSKAPFLINAAP